MEDRYFCIPVFPYFLPAAINVLHVFFVVVAVDASAAGEGQLEISINEGEVPNHVQVVGGGRCLVSFTPEQAKPHYIDIKFNGETVNGCPFVCSVADTSRVLLNLSNLGEWLEIYAAAFRKQTISVWNTHTHTNACVWMHIWIGAFREFCSHSAFVTFILHACMYFNLISELIPVDRSSSFHITVSGGGAAELAVSVRGPQGELPVRISGDVQTGFTAEFTPTSVGAHTINVEYNGYAVQVGCRLPSRIEAYTSLISFCANLIRKESAFVNNGGFEFVQQTWATKYETWKLIVLSSYVMSFNILKMYFFVRVTLAEWSQHAEAFILFCIKIVYIL